MAGAQKFALIFRFPIVCFTDRRQRTTTDAYVMAVALLTQSSRSENEIALKLLKTTYLPFNIPHSLVE